MYNVSPNIYVQPSDFTKKFSIIKKHERMLKNDWKESSRRRLHISKFIKWKFCNSVYVKQAWWSSWSSDGPASNKNKMTIECHGREDHIFLSLLSLRGPMTGWTFESRESRFIARRREILSISSASRHRLACLPISSIPEKTTHCSNNRALFTTVSQIHFSHGRCVICNSEKTKIKIFQMCSRNF